jgi:adenylate kinase family enzyme
MKTASSLKARRILIYGVCGSGKSTFAKRLSRATGLPLHLVDDLAFLDNWQPRPDEEQRRAIELIVDQDAWILDTAYGKWLELPLARAELILGLDYPRWFSLQRLLRRTITRIITREPVCNNNRESLRLALSRQSIILWHFKSFARKRSRMRQWAAEEPERVILFKSAAEAEAWLKRLTMP